MTDIRPPPLAPLTARRVKIFFDGGCRPNPGAMEIAVVVRGVAHVRRDIGHGTSFDAEWLALIEALRIVRTIGFSDYVLLGDSVGVIAQATGAAHCPRAALDHRAALLAMLPPGAPLPVRYVKRTQNLAGIALARLHER